MHVIDVVGLFPALDHASNVLPKELSRQFLAALPPALTCLGWLASSGRHWWEPVATFCWVTLFCRHCPPVACTAGMGVVAVVLCSSPAFHLSTWLVVVGQLGSCMAGGIPVGRVGGCFWFCFLVGCFFTVLSSCLVTCDTRIGT